MRFATPKAEVSLVLLIGAAMSSAVAEDLNLVGRSLKVVRKNLIASGWQPKPAEQAKDQIDSNVSALWSQELPELYACTGTGLNYCWAQYRKGKECLSIQTQGERNPRVHRVLTGCTHP